jgi:hypothetical protein
VTEAVSVTKARIHIGAPQCGQTRGNTSSILARRVAPREEAYAQGTVSAAALRVRRRVACWQARRRLRGRWRRGASRPRRHWRPPGGVERQPPVIAVTG